MPDSDLRIHLRRKFIEQTTARRPRLSGNLRQLGAVGPAVRPLAATSQKAFVKVVITKGTTTGAHLAYLTRAQNPVGQEATLFGPGAGQKTSFVQGSQHDPHQFRIIVQVPAHRQLDRTCYIELFMAQVERDLGRPLDWTAAHHYDTAYPHTHIVLRGQDRDGKDLYMAKDYMTYGLRARASQLLTWLLGPRRDQAQERSMGDRGFQQGQGRSQAEVLASARLATQTQASVEGVQTSSVGEAPQIDTSLAAQVDALKQDLARRQHDQQQRVGQARQAQQRGGWGHGR